MGALEFETFIPLQREQMARQKLSDASIVDCSRKIVGQIEQLVAERAIVLGEPAGEGVEFIITRPDNSTYTVSTMREVGGQSVGEDIIVYATGDAVSSRIEYRRIRAEGFDTKPPYINIAGSISGWGMICRSIGYMVITPDFELSE